mmetsp:Transcript_11086/g.40626  ORF Transcript_11086/g.40626 Transcript_11086/m.40626 type:complete len:376 (-) Transcript_11086:78-1205(-)
MSESKDGDSRLWVNVFAVVVLLTAQTMMSVSNKMLLNMMHYPISFTMLHMVMSSLVTRVLIASHIRPRQTVLSMGHLLKVGLLGALFIISVVAGNYGIQICTIGFVQILGATGPTLSALITFLLLGRMEHVYSWICLAVMLAGVVIASEGEIRFTWLGVLAVVISNIARGFKSVLTELLLKNQDEKLDEVNLLSLMSPLAFMIAIPFSIFVEPNFSEDLLSHMDSGFLVLLVTNMLTAAAQNLCNFFVTKLTSAVTLQVIGQSKGAIIVLLSGMLFHTPLSKLSLLGYAITVLGTVAYQRTKSRFAPTTSSFGGMVNLVRSPSTDVLLVAENGDSSSAKAPQSKLHEYLHAGVLSFMPVVAGTGLFASTIAWFCR